MDRAEGASAEESPLARVVMPLVLASQLSLPSDLATVIAESLAGLGASEVDVYVVDHQLSVLVATPGSHHVDTDEHRLAIDGSPPGRCFEHQETVVTGNRIHLPISEGADRLGVLALTLDPDMAPERIVLDEAAVVIGQLLSNRDQYTDTYIRTRRLQPMQLRAEMQWNLLPPLNLSCRAVSVAGLLEPAYHIGGDAFDYALNGDVLHFAIFDSMGHDLAASLVASLAVAAYRNCRREGVGFDATLEAIDTAIADQFGGEKFVTLQFGELDTSTRICRWVNAGHPLPVLSRSTDIVGQVGCAPSVPAGLGARVVETAELQMRPDDALLLYSDGTTEARDVDGGQFGEERLQTLFATGRREGQLPADIVRRILFEVVAHEREPLRDDATVLLITLPRD
ncbi:MAG: protein serine/threonine phosphatase [Actinomycetia bacterium]|nr:protein serine/threonine phosphatase [Actinomycetes bacterium]